MKPKFALLTSLFLMGFSYGVLQSHGPVQNQDAGSGCCSSAELQAKKRAYFNKFARRQSDGTFRIERESVNGRKMILITNDKGQCLKDHPCASDTKDEDKDRNCKRCSDWRNGCSENTDMCCCLPYGNPPRRDKCECQPPDDPAPGPPTK